MPAARRHGGLGIVPYFPLASGLLTGKYKREGGGGSATCTFVNRSIMAIPLP